MLFLITDSFSVDEKYNRSLYLLYNEYTKTVSLCISGSITTLCVEVSSTPLYSQWLIENYKNLLSMEQEEWFNYETYYDFHFMLLEYIKENILKVEWQVA